MHCADASTFTLLVPIMRDGPLNLDKELRLSDPLLLFHTYKGYGTNTQAHTHLITTDTFNERAAEKYQAENVIYFYQILS